MQWSVVLLQFMWMGSQAQEPFLQGMEVVGFALDIADMFIGAADQKEVLDKLKEIKDELDKVKEEEDKIIDDVKAVQKEVAWGFSQMTGILKSQELDDAHATIMGGFDQLQTQAAGRGGKGTKAELDHLAKSITGDAGSPIIAARSKYFEVYDGTLQSNIKDGRTILEYFFEQEGLLPVKLARSLARSMVLAQALVTWAYTQQGDLASRKSDINTWTAKYQTAWERAKKNVFYNANCTWGSGEDFRASNITDLTCKPRSDLQGLHWTSKGWEKSYADHNFSLRCANGAVMTGMNGTYDIADLAAWQVWDGYQLHCSDGHSTSSSAYPGVGPDGYRGHTHVDFQLQSPDKEPQAVFSINGCETYVDFQLQSPDKEPQAWPMADFINFASHSNEVSPFTFPGSVPCRSIYSQHQKELHFTCPAGYAMVGISGQAQRGQGNKFPYPMTSTINAYRLECGLATDLIWGATKKENAVLV